MPSQSHVATHRVAFTVTGMLEQEHRTIHRVVASMSALADELEHGSEAQSNILRDLVSFLRVFLDQCHHAKEDQCLFPLLESKGIPASGCPIGALQHEHENGRALASQLTEAIESYTSGAAAARPLLISTLRNLVELYPGHIWKEDYLLIPMANKVLTDGDQRNLAASFENVEKQIGRGLHEQMEAFPASLERAIQRLAAARGEGVAPVREPGPTGSPVLDFDLREHIEELNREQDWQSGRNSQTIVKYPDFRIVLTVLRSGTLMHEHHAAGPISVHVLSGHIRMRVEGREIDLPPGHVLALDRSIPHDVEAVEDSAFLLTIAWPPDSRPGSAG
jgi:hemerythrin-like domain-containing protein/quercetin dioxygenase-like cupin family protein